MAGVTLAAILGPALAALALHLVSVALTKALRTYSRSRLEEVCADGGHPDRADAIAHLGERTERAMEALGVLTGLVLAAALGAALDRWADRFGTGALIAAALALAGLGHVAAGVVGRVHAELVLDALWPASQWLRRLMTPFVGLSRLVEAAVYRRSRRAAEGPRPPSVEVEIHVDLDEDEHEEDFDAELPEAVRETIERLVELTRLDAAELMTPRTAIKALPVIASARDAAQLFADTGFSRVPLYGEHRDDIVGILYAKDLYQSLVDADHRPEPVAPRKLARPALFVPETKNAYELLDEFRSRQVQMAVVLDEYGGVAGLVTLEDLLEQIVGPIHDEHDPVQPADPVQPLGPGSFEVAATLDVDELNERLDLDIPTDGDFSTVGGLAFSVLGRVPEPGESFRYAGVEFTILEVAEHSIRRLRLDLQPADEPVPGHAPG